MLEHNPNEYVCGADEVGRGCLFGPVVAAAVVFPKELSDSPLWNQIKDSKKISEKKRKILSNFIIDNALAYSIQEISHAIIDEINILESSITAMEYAIDDVYKQLENKDIALDSILIDGNKFRRCYMIPGKDITIPHICCEKGDNTYLCIAAASIISKVYRDNMIVAGCDNNEEWNRYDFKNNKGYGTKKHKDALKIYGPIYGHRMSFKGI
jgi:ribonuclease HII